MGDMNAKVSVGRWGEVDGGFGGQMEGEVDAIAEYFMKV